MSENGMSAPLKGQWLMAMLPLISAKREQRFWTTGRLSGSLGDILHIGFRQDVDDIFLVDGHKEGRTVSPHFPSDQLIPGTSRTYVWQLRYSTWKLLFRQWEGYSRFEKLAVISASPSYEQIP